MIKERSCRHVLGPDDMHVGQLVTVHRGRRQGCMFQHGEAYRAYKGVPLEIAALNFPYVLTLQAVSRQETIIVDLRQADLCRCSAEYLAAMRKAFGLPETPGVVTPAAASPCAPPSGVVAVIVDDPQQKGAG